MTQARGTCLADAPLHVPLQVLSVSDVGAMTDRLVEFGMTPGARVEILRRAPWSGPLLIRLRHFVLTMRPDAARAVRVQAAGEQPDG
ncbi:MAG: ferrous iron transport protein A [Myxococcales bacterium]|nr:ferrous iron transport protein A [Myxococcales bacterium]